MIVRYTGSRHGGITQIGRTPIRVPWNTPVEIPDDLGTAMVAQYPDEWAQLDPPPASEAAKIPRHVKTKTARKLETASDESTSSDESPEEATS